MLRWILLALLSAGILFMARPMSRLDFPRYHKLPEYYWVSDYGPPAQCREVIVYLKQNGLAALLSAKCVYARRYEVWWLAVQNLTRLQLPQIVSLF